MKIPSKDRIDRLDKWFHKKKGQNTAEYSILFGVAIAAIVAIGTYVKRGSMARVADATDHMMTADDGTGQEIFHRTQYVPYYVKSETDTEKTQQSNE